MLALAILKIIRHKTSEQARLSPILPEYRLVLHLHFNIAQWPHIIPRLYAFQICSPFIGQSSFTFLQTKLRKNNKLRI